MLLNPANYWRKNKNWNNFVGKLGEVVFVTRVEVTSPELQSFLPYCFAIVEMDGERYEFMGEKGVELKKGDKVEFAFRKVSDSDNASLINYGIKLVLKSRTFFSSGKVILSGEHSVVYGEPALISSINLGISASIEEKINKVGKNSKAGYLNHIFKIFNEKFSDLNFDTDNLKIKIDSNLPRKSGLGSSAAYAHVIFLCLLNHFNLILPEEEIFNLVWQAEKFIHGNSSGADPSAVVFGGVQIFRKGKRKMLKSFSKMDFILVNSGKPEESTGEMVSLVKTKVESSDFFSKTIKEIGQVTSKMINSIESDNFNPSLLSQNERLLEKIGVVGKKAKNMIKEIENHGGFAKITGAGGVKKGSGWILAYHPDKNGLDTFLSQNTIESYKIEIK